MLQDFIGVRSTMHLVHQVLQLLLIMNLVYIQVHVVYKLVYKCIQVHVVYKCIQIYTCGTNYIYIGYDSYPGQSSG